MTSNILPALEFKHKVQYERSTAIIRQYFDIKVDHQDCLVLFRVGDFYELFFDDAVIASKVLGLAMAKRGLHADKPILMCGVPHHALEPYLHKLIDHNYKVAICEQIETLEEAKKRGYKAIVRREVIRVVTPGTITEEGLVNTSKPNYLVSLAANNSIAAISYVDIAIAEIGTIEIPLAQASSYLASLNPKELILSERAKEIVALSSILQSYQGKIVYQTESCFAPNKTTRTIESFYHLQSLKGIGMLSVLQVATLGVILEYLLITQRSNLPHLPLPTIINPNDTMVIDPSTRRNLELTITSSGGYKGSLLATIDHTVTKGGNRLLYRYLTTPLINREKIVARLEVTEFFYQNSDLTAKIRVLLAHIGDLDRAVTRVSMNRAAPKDLLQIAAGLQRSENIKDLIMRHKDNAAASQIIEGFSTHPDLCSLIRRAIKEDSPAQLNEGGFIKLDYHPKVAELYNLLENGQAIINSLKLKYQQHTGVDALKINHNNLIGLFIEVSSKQASKMTDKLFIHRQSTLNTIRYVTTELQELEAKMLSARSTVINLEKELFQQIGQRIIAQIDGLRLLASALSSIDVFCALAHLATERKYIKPLMTDNKELAIIGGRHPVIEYSLQYDHDSFVANDCSLSDEQRVWLITGPNMAGKSTFLRQNILILLLAQIGSFVPAKAATIGIADKIFSRIGAGDDLAAGQSTFMMEMLETSAILAQATARSMIILDEIGRGTAVYDGLSIAWAVVEHIHNHIRCRSLFATHYHELAQLADTLTAASNHFSTVEEHNDTIIFNYKVLAGTGGKSYGIHVAARAGLPSMVLERARELLNSLESSVQHHNRDKIAKLLSYITAIPTEGIDNGVALNLLQEVKNLAREC